MELSKVQIAALLMSLALKGILKTLSEQEVETISRQPVSEWPPELMEIVKGYLPQGY